MDKDKLSRLHRLCDQYCKQFILRCTLVDFADAAISYYDSLAYMYMALSRWTTTIPSPSPSRRCANCRTYGP